MQVGVDSYSYHRLYGETRQGELELPERWPPQAAPALRHARSAGAEVVFLETCFLPAPEFITADSLRDADGMNVGFSWGHPWPPGAYPGLDGGRSRGAEEELGRWIDATARLNQSVLRITAGTAASRGSEPAHVLIRRLVDPVRRAADRAAAFEVSLALENHGDMRAEEILELLRIVDRPNIGVCLDNVNLIRVGDDMLEGTRLLAHHTLLVQLKDHRPGNSKVPGGPISTALGDGVADLAGVLAILQESAYAGAVCVEIASLGGGTVDELSMIERSVRWLSTQLRATGDATRQSRFGFGPPMGGEVGAQLTRPLNARLGLSTRMRSTSSDGSPALINSGTNRVRMKL